MGFFKKIGNAVKKGLKQISLKNIVKIGTPLLGAIPLVGGVVQGAVQNISQAHEMKLEAKRLEEEGKAQEALAMQQQAEFLAQQAGAQVGQQAGGQFKAFTKGAANEFKAQVSDGTNQVIGQAGATVVDLTISQWLKLHWLKIVLALGAIGGLIYYFKNKDQKKRPVRRQIR
ncbi:hypothetical protein [Flavobacterium sp.]|uniref:hypothetical protein n=1 Tax=Flavobacterium sp. TaxID=239 RepID=UPI0026243DFD|nr:hypothetical protein [Flavobacterium sp.]